MVSSLALPHTKRQMHTTSFPQPNVPSSAPDQTIAFALTGRITLSETLPPETISVPIDLINRSPFLAGLLTSTPRRHPIPLPNIDPAAFHYYLQYLSYGRITYVPDSTSPQSPRSFAPDSHGVQLRDCIDLIFAHIAGGRMQEPGFQSEVLQEMDRVLDAVQSPDMRVLETMVLEEGVGEALWRGVVGRMFMVERRMLGLLRGSVGSGSDGFVSLVEENPCGIERREERMEGCGWDVAGRRALGRDVPSQYEGASDGQGFGPCGFAGTLRHAPRRSVSVECEKPLPIIPSLSVRYGGPSNSTEMADSLLQRTCGLVKTDFFEPDMISGLSRHHGQLQRKPPSSRPATGLNISCKPVPAHGHD